MKSYSAADFQADMHGPDPRMEELAYLQARLETASALLVQSQPLTGTLFTEQGPMDVSDAVAAFAVGNVVYRFGTWVVTQDGVACLVHHYPLTHARLQEREDWARHLAEQPWVNLWDALRALRVVEHMAQHREHGGPYGDGAHPS
ncbi:MAG TPA: hypothetical protein VLA19_07365 [Herpetosiphonaceae bacterium]|nr:hypothetical protein [Herpetosiphonaceae bacterium]